VRRLGLRPSQIEKLEQEAVRKDPIKDRSGARSYTPGDIEALEQKMVPWLRRRRRS